MPYIYLPRTVLHINANLPGCVHYPSWDVPDNRVYIFPILKLRFNLHFPWEITQLSIFNPPQRQAGGSGCSPTKKCSIISHQKKIQNECMHFDSAFGYSLSPTPRQTAPVHIKSTARVPATPLKTIFDVIHAKYHFIFPQNKRVLKEM